MFLQNLHPYLRLLLVLAFGILLGLLIGWRNGQTGRRITLAETPGCEEPVWAEPASFYARPMNWSPAENSEDRPLNPELSAGETEKSTGREHVQTTLWGSMSIHPL